MIDRIKVTLIPGDGIGPEITEATKRVLQAVGTPFQWDECYAGEKAFNSYGAALPGDTVRSINERKLVLKGPLATPSGGGYRSATVQLREKFDLFANVRPAVTLFPGRFDFVDIILVRENVQGLYAADEIWIAQPDDPHAVAVSTAYNTKSNLKRLLRFTAEMAIKNGRSTVTVVHKANILKKLTGIFLEAMEEVRGDYPTLQFNDMIVDACAMKLVTQPEKFDVIVTTNLFGDILSDLISGLVGGLGVTPGGNIGEEVAMFEAVHGTAPDIAGKYIANPTAMIMASCLLLDHVGLNKSAEAIRHSVATTIRLGEGTGDVKGKNDTLGFAALVADRAAAIFADF